MLSAIEVEARSSWSLTSPALGMDSRMGESQATNAIASLYTSSFSWSKKLFCGASIVCSGESVHGVRTKIGARVGVRVRVGAEEGKKKLTTSFSDTLGGRPVLRASANEQRRGAAADCAW